MFRKNCIASKMSMPGNMTEPDIPEIESLICFLPASTTCIDYDITHDLQQVPSLL